MLWAIVAIGGAVAVFCVLSWFTLDRPAARFVYNNDITGHPFWQAITKLGESKWYLWPLGVLVIVTLIVKRRMIRERALFAFTAIALTGGLVHIPKFLFGRARPRLFVHEDIWGLSPINFGEAYYHYASFPSGHSTTAGALTMALCLIWPRLSVLWVPLGLLVGVSRVMVGAHYPSDVAAGLFLGGAMTVWIRTWFEGNGGWVQPGPRLWVRRGVTG